METSIETAFESAIETAFTSVDIATLTSSAWEAISTAISDLPEWDDGGLSNGTDTGLPDLGSPDTVSGGSYVLVCSVGLYRAGGTCTDRCQNTFIGLLIVLASSLINAFGLNLTKLDHLRSQAVPKRERKKEWMRWMWLAGMGLYM
jgi:hypothetical protein